MSKDSMITNETVERSRRQLLAAAGGLTATPLAGCTAIPNSPDDTTQSKTNEFPTKAGPPIKLLGRVYEDTDKLSEAIQCPVKRLFSEEANPTLYHNPERWPTADKISIELEHDPYPQRDIANQSTKVMTKELRGTKTSIDLSENALGTYIVTYRILDEDGAELYTTNEEIEIGSTDEILIGSTDNN